MLEIIASIQEKIFADQYSEAMEPLLVLIDKLEKKIISFPEVEQRKFFRIAQALVEQMKNKNILAVADILEYEIRPFLISLEERNS